MTNEEKIKRRIFSRIQGAKESRGQVLNKISLEPLKPRNLEPFLNKEVIRCGI